MAGKTKSQKLQDFNVRLPAAKDVHSKPVIPLKYQEEKQTKAW
jgi:hypothetical protein